MLWKSYLKLNLEQLSHSMSVVNIFTLAVRHVFLNISQKKNSLQTYCGKVVPNLISSNFSITCPVKILLVWLVLSKYKKINKLLKTSQNMHCRVSNESSRYSASNENHNWEFGEKKNFVILS